MAIQVVGEDDGIFNQEDYILFYGESPIIWDYDPSSKHFNHVMNWYSNSTAYFITIGNESGKRIPLRYGSQLAQNKTIDTLDLLLYHHNEWVNPGKTGKVWLGESFEDNSPLEIDFNFSGYDVFQSGHYINTNLAANSTANSNFEIKVNEGLLKNIPVQSYYSHYRVYSVNESDTTFSFEGPTLEISYTYDFPNDSSIGWLDFLELNLKISPQFSGGQMSLRSTQNIGEGNISKYYLNTDSPENMIVWDVSDPLNVERIVLNVETDHVWFKLENDQLLEFLAFDGEAFFQPEFSDEVENQNLQAANASELLIITHPDFLSQANLLAEFHEMEDDMSSGVFTTEQIYNEFSSGSQDVSAIRNFIWHLYDLSEEENRPKYILLFGDASYDYKDITENNSNYVPTYISIESASLIRSYASDRFYSLKYLLEPNDINLAIGRMPVNSTAQADQAIEKIENYSSNQSLGSWKNEMMFIADDGDMGLHQNDANILTVIADTNNPVMNLNKCYLDFFELIETNEGNRYPEVNQEIQDKVNNGVYFVNYTGHGGEDHLSEEKILIKEDLTNWTNGDNLSLWVLASSEVANYINPEKVSIGEAIYLKENAGAIGLYGTSGINYASYNFRFNQAILQKLTDKSLQGNMRFGDLLPPHNSSSFYYLKWTFFGDPALKIKFPEHQIVTTKINSKPIEEYNDTISPGSILNIEGEILSIEDNSPLVNFNGNVYLKVFAPAYLQSTMGNQGNPVEEFKVQQDILNTAEAIVEDGVFEIQIALPNQDAPDYGQLKLSWYAENGQSDANGFYNELLYGGHANSISEIDGILNQIKVYPTPFMDQIYIETPPSLNLELNYKIYNSMGHMIFENSHSNKSDLEKIDLPNLAKGIYVLNVYNEAGSKSFKLLKN